MSRIGKEPVKLPAKVEVKQIGEKIEIKGPLGTLQTPIYSGIEMTVEEGVVRFTRNKDDKQAMALHGLVRALFNNSVKGVTQGWEKKFRNLWGWI